MSLRALLNYFLSCLSLPTVCSSLYCFFAKAPLKLSSSFEKTRFSWRLFMQGTRPLEALIGWRGGPRCDRWWLVFSFRADFFLPDKILAWRITCVARLIFRVASAGVYKIAFPWTNSLWIAFKMQIIAKVALWRYAVSSPERSTTRSISPSLVIPIKMRKQYLLDWGEFRVKRTWRHIRKCYDFRIIV